MNGTRSCGTQCQSSSRNTGVQTKRLSTEEMRYYTKIVEKEKDILLKYIQTTKTFLPKLSFKVNFEQVHKTSGSDNVDTNSYREFEDAVKTRAFNCQTKYKENNGYPISSTRLNDMRRSIKIRSSSAIDDHEYDNNEDLLSHDRAKSRKRKQPRRYTRCLQDGKEGYKHLNAESYLDEQSTHKTTNDQESVPENFEHSTPDLSPSTTLASQLPFSPSSQRNSTESASSPFEEDDTCSEESYFSSTPEDFDDNVSKCSEEFFIVQSKQDVVNGKKGLSATVEWPKAMDSSDNEDSEESNIKELEETSKGEILSKSDIKHNYIENQLNRLSNEDGTSIAEIKTSTVQFPNRNIHDLEVPIYQIHSSNDRRIPHQATSVQRRPSNDTHIGHQATSVHIHPSNDRHIPHQVTSVQRHPSNDRHIPHQATSVQGHPSNDRHIPHQVTSVQRHPSNDRYVPHQATSVQRHLSNDRYVPHQATSVQRHPSNDSHIPHQATGVQRHPSYDRHIPHQATSVQRHPSNDTHIPHHATNLGVPSNNASFFLCIPSSKSSNVSSDLPAVSPHLSRLLLGETQDYKIPVTQQSTYEHIYPQRISHRSIETKGTSVTKEKPLHSSSQIISTSTRSYYNNSMVTNGISLQTNPHVDVQRKNIPTLTNIDENNEINDPRRQTSDNDSEMSNKKRKRFIYGEDEPQKKKVISSLLTPLCEREATRLADGIHEINMQYFPLRSLAQKAANRVSEDAGHFYQFIDQKIQLKTKLA